MKNLGGLSRTTYTSSAKNPGGVLTLEKLEETYEAVLKMEEKERKRINKLISSKSWQRENRQMRRLLEYLFGKPGRTEDYLTAYRCWASMQPNINMPVSLKTKERCEELLREMQDE